MISEIRSGLSFIYRNPVLQSLAGSAGLFNFFSQLQLTLYVLYAARVNASFRFAIGALMPVSALLAGLLGEQLGLRATLFITAAGLPLSVVWIALSPTRRVGAVEELAPQAAVTAWDRRSGCSRTSGGGLPS